MMPVTRISVRPRGGIGAVDSTNGHGTDSTGSSPTSSQPGSPENGGFNFNSGRPKNDRCQRIQSASGRRCASPNVLLDVTKIQAKRLNELYGRLSPDLQSDPDDGDGENDTASDTYSHSNRSGQNKATTKKTVTNKITASSRRTPASTLTSSPSTTTKCSKTTTTTTSNKRPSATLRQGSIEGRNIRTNINRAKPVK